MEHSPPLTPVRLGRTDLAVTRYCQGTAFRHLERNARDPKAERVLRHCLDAGELSPRFETDPGSPLAEMHATLDEAAGQLGVGRAQVCVAWVLDHPEVTSVLAGPESTAHVDETLAGAALKLPAELRATLDAASGRYGERMEEAGRAASSG